MKKLIKQWRYEIVMVLFVLLLMSTIRGWVAAKAYETNYRMCQSNVEEIRELYNNKNN
jgi:hypothetical protein